MDTLAKAKQSKWKPVGEGKSGRAVYYSSSSQDVANIGMQVSSIVCSLCKFVLASHEKQKRILVERNAACASARKDV